MKKNLALLCVFTCFYSLLVAQELSPEEIKHRIDSIQKVREVQFFEDAKSRIVAYANSTSKDTILSLNFSDARLTEIPPFVEECVNLKRINLSNNQIDRLPKYFKKFDNLETIYWNGNSESRFKFPKIKSVKFIRIRGGELERFPKHVRKLKSLVELDLAKNKIKSNPKWLFKFDSLKELKLDENPVDLLSFKYQRFPENLEILKLNKCGLKLVPKEVYSLDVVELQFRENSIETIPDGISKMANLRKISFYKNQLIDLPSDFYEIDGMESLDLYYNNLKSIKPEIANFDSLKILYLSHNDLYEVPKEIGEMTQLDEFYLHHNHLSSIPDSFSNLKMLRTFRVNDNNLATFPMAIHGMSSLKYLDITGNLLETLPSTLLQLTELELFAFERNEINYQDPENHSLLLMVEKMQENGVTCIPSISRDGSQ